MAEEEQTSNDASNVEVTPSAPPTVSDELTEAQKAAEKAAEKAIKNAAHATKVNGELLSTEQQYNAQLKILTTNLRTLLDDKNNGLSEKQKAGLELMLAQLTPILGISNAALSQLETINNPKSSADQVMAAHQAIVGYLETSVPFYAKYAEKYNDHTNILNDLQKTKKTEQYDSLAKGLVLKEANTEGAVGAGSLTAHDLIITPVQRLPRFEMLYKDLLKHSDPNKASYKQLEGATERIQKSASRVNSNIKAIEQANSMAKYDRAKAKSPDGLTKTSQNLVVTLQSPAGSSPKLDSIKGKLESTAFKLRASEKSAKEFSFEPSQGNSLILKGSKGGKIEINVDDKNNLQITAHRGKLSFDDLEMIKVMVHQLQNKALGFTKPTVEGGKNIKALFNDLMGGPKPFMQSKETVAPAATTSAATTPAATTSAAATTPAATPPAATPAARESAQGPSTPDATAVAASAPIVPKPEAPKPKRWSLIGAIRDFIKQLIPSNEPKQKASKASSSQTTPKSSSDTTQGMTDTTSADANLTSKLAAMVNNPAEAAPSISALATTDAKPVTSGFISMKEQSKEQEGNLKQVASKTPPPTPPKPAGLIPADVKTPPPVAPRADRSPKI